MEISRKSFVAGAGMAAAATALAGSAAIASAEEPNPSGIPEVWDYETDVVVVGSGSIISAALRAHDQGLDVLVLEKHPTWFGGTTAISGGGMSCPNGTFNLNAGCPEIPRDLLKDYLMDVAEGHSSEELVDMMIDNYAPAVDYLNDECGYKWISFGQMPNCFYNYYNPFPAIEEAYPDVPCWVTIGDHEATGRQSGPALPEYAKDALEARGIEVMMGTPATRLIYAGNPALGDGEVVGVWAEKDGNPIAIKARYAVVLGTGGFDNNRDMVEHYIDAPIYATTAIETNTGDGHIMAAEIGASLKNMNEVFNQAFNMCEGPEGYLASDLDRFDGTRDSVMRSHIWITPGATGSIIVNRHGERFVDESTSYDLFGRAFHAFDPARKEWRNVPAYVIMDGSFASNLGNGCGTIGSVTAADERPAWFHEFATMEELAEGMGIDSQNLLATVERYNGFCETGVDKDWARGENTWDRFTSGDMARFESGELANPCLSPLVEGPFYCVELYPGMLQTCGGIEINGNAQAVNVRGEVIPRLYAGSCCAASPLGRGYAFGGTTLSIGYVVGYVAANHIATLQPWE